MRPSERDRLAAAFAATGALQCGFCTPGIVVRRQGPARQEGRGPRPRRPRPATSAPTCAAAPATSRSSTPSRLLAAGESTIPVARPAASATGGMRYQGERARPRRQGLHRRHPRRRAAARRACTSPTTPGPTSCASTRRAAEAVAGRRARCSPRPTCPASCGSASSTRTGRSSSPRAGARPTSATCSPLVVAEDRATAAPGGRARRGRLRRRCRPITDPVAAVDDAEDAVWGLDGNVLSRSTYARGDVDAGARRPAPTSCTRCSRPSASSTPSSSPSRRSPCPLDRTARAARLLGRPGRVGRPRPDRLGARRRARRASSSSWCRNGGAFGGKEDMSNQAQTALAAWLLQRPVKCTLSPRGVAAHAPQAPPDPHRVPRPAATPTGGSPRCGSAWSATRGPTPRSA